MEVSFEKFKRKKSLTVADGWKCECDFSRPDPSKIECLVIIKQKWPVFSNAIKQFGGRGGNDVTSSLPIC